MKVFCYIKVQHEWKEEVGIIYHRRLAEIFFKSKKDQHFARFAFNNHKNRLELCELLSIITFDIRVVT